MSNPFVFLCHNAQVVGYAKYTRFPGHEIPSTYLHNRWLVPFARPGEKLVSLQDVQIFSEFESLPCPYAQCYPRPPVTLGDFNNPKSHFSEHLVWNLHNTLPNPHRNYIGYDPRVVSVRVLLPLAEYLARHGVYISGDPEDEHDNCIQVNSTPNVAERSPAREHAGSVSQPRIDEYTELFDSKAGSSSRHKSKHKGAERSASKIAIPDEEFDSMRPDGKILPDEKILVEGTGSERSRILVPDTTPCRCFVANPGPTAKELGIWAVGHQIKDCPVDFDNSDTDRPEDTPAKQHFGPVLRLWRWWYPEFFDRWPSSSPQLKSESKVAENSETKVAIDDEEFDTTHPNREILPDGKIFVQGKGNEESYIIVPDTTPCRCMIANPGPTAVKHGIRPYGHQLKECPFSLTSDSDASLSFVEAIQDWIRRSTVDNKRCISALSMAEGLFTWQSSDSVFTGKERSEDSNEDSATDPDSIPVHDSDTERNIHAQRATNKRPRKRLRERREKDLVEIQRISQSPKRISVWSARGCCVAKCFMHMDPEYTFAQFRNIQRLSEEEKVSVARSFWRREERRFFVDGVYVCSKFLDVWLGISERLQVKGTVSKVINRKSDPHFSGTRADNDKAFSPFSKFSTEFSEEDWRRFCGWS